MRSRDLGASARTNGSTRMHHDDAARGAGEPRPAHLPAAATITRASTGCCTATALTGGCCAAARRCADADGAATRLAGSLTDITDAKVSDALTGLPNRLMFVDLLERAIRRDAAAPGSVFALLSSGSTVQRRRQQPGTADGGSAAGRGRPAAADRACACTDTVTRGRDRFTWRDSGGDEFTVLLDEITDADDAVRVAERLRVPWRNRSRSTGSRCSRRPRSASRSARPAMTVRGDPARCRDGAPPGEGRRPALVRDLRSGDARARGGAPAARDRSAEGGRGRAFEVYYQPIVAVGSGRIVAFEALARWRHPLRGLIGPLEFIGSPKRPG